MTYDGCPLNDVWNGDETWQYGFVTKVPFSGTASRMPHQSFSTLPVLVPPEKVTPFTLRTLKVMSTPLNTRRSSPMSFVDLSTRFCTRVNASAVLLYSGPTCVMLPLGSRPSESLGTVRVNGVMSFGSMFRSSVITPPVVYIVNTRR